MAIHLLGIRHHGPGSCRNVLNYLQELQPDLILVEGPAEAEALLPCVENPGSGGDVGNGMRQYAVCAYPQSGTYHH